MRPTRVSIDLCALRHNLQQARRAAPGCRVMAAVKANAYGHGLVTVARALQPYCEDFGVASLEEALILREAGIRGSLTLLEGFFQLDELPLIREQQLSLLLHHPDQIAALLQSEPGNAPIPVWLKIDTGMHRLGVRPDQAADYWQRLKASDQVTPLGQMTHLACADEHGHPATPRQLEEFRQATATLDGLKSIANSAGVLAWPQSHADVVRPGIMLYGISPFIGGEASAHELRPVMTFHSALIAINWMEKGDAIGYGDTWVCPEAMPVGVVAAGYGDGYPRHAPSGTPVLVNGREVPLIGRVSMDMLTVDLRDQPGARIGDPVVLWGEGLAAESVAEAAGTIAYELLCRLTPRVRVETTDE